MPLGDAFVVEARWLASASVATFAQTFTLTVAYTGGGGLDQGSLRVAFRDPSAGRWVNLPTEIDAEARVLTVTTNQAGEFAVFGVPTGRVFLPLMVR